MVKKIIKTVLPLVKKYGAAVVGLTLDEMVFLRVQIKDLKLQREY